MKQVNKIIYTTFGIFGLVACIAAIVKAFEAPSLGSVEFLVIGMGCALVSKMAAPKA